MLGFQGGVSIPLVKGGVKAPPAKRKCRAAPKAVARHWLYFHHVSSTPTTADREMRHGTDRQSDTPKPYHHRRFPGPIHLLPADQRWQGVCRVCPRLSPFPGLSALP